jgi:hypothetical protein
LQEVKPPRAGRTTARFKPGALRAFSNISATRSKRATKRSRGADRLSFKHGFDAAMREKRTERSYQTFQTRSSQSPKAFTEGKKSAFHTPRPPQLSRFDHEAEHLFRADQNTS